MYTTSGLFRQYVLKNYIFIRENFNFINIWTVSHFMFKEDSEVNFKGDQSYLIL